jgi:Cys-rich repeat protein
MEGVERQATHPRAPNLNGARSCRRRSYDDPGDDDPGDDDPGDDDPGGDDPECVTDSDCATGELCEDGTCQVIVL